LSGRFSDNLKFKLLFLGIDSGLEIQVERKLQTVLNIVSDIVLQFFGRWFSPAKTEFLGH
jgi:hypothetical protein